MAADSSFASAARKWRIKNIVFLILLAAILMLGSGRVGWIAGWCYVLLVAAGPLGTYVLLARKSPDLLVERSKLQAGTKSWDKVLAPIIVLVPLGMWIVAALDARYGWSQFPAIWQAAGFLLIAAGIPLTLWAMAANRFFAATVRIQTDRGHAVVSSGPYAYVRHPGYVGMLAYMIGTPLALDSAWAMIPGALCESRHSNCLSR